MKKKCPCCSTAATVACRDMGNPGGMKMQAWQFGPSNGLVLISDVTCTGAESRLTQCRFTGWGNTNVSTLTSVMLFKLFHRTIVSIIAFDFCQRFHIMLVAFEYI